MCRGLTFSQLAAAPAGLVGRVERLDHDALVAAGERVVEHGRGGRGVLGHGARDPLRRSGTRRSSAAHALGERAGRAGPRRRGAARRRSARVSGTAPRWRSTSVRLPKPRGGDLEGLRAPVAGAGRSPRRRARGGGAGSASAASTTSGTRAVTSSRLRVKTATSRVAPVHLDARAVELVLDRRRVHALERAGDVGGGLGEHGLQRAADLEAERRRAPRRRSRERDGGDRAEVAAQHQRAADRGARHLGGARHRVDHHARLGRPGAARRVSTPRQEALLRGGRAREQRGERLAPRALGAGARPARRSARRRRRVSRDGQRRLGRRRPATSRSAAQPTPIWRWRSSPERNATPASTSSGASRRSASASAVDLAQPGRGRGHGLRGLHEAGEQHGEHRDASPRPARPIRTL